MRDASGAGSAPASSAAPRPMSRATLPIALIVCLRVVTLANEGRAQTPPRQLPSGADGATEYDSRLIESLPRERHSSLIDFVARNEPGARLQGGSALPSLRGGTPVGTALLVDGLHHDGDRLPLLLFDRALVTSFGHGAALAHAPGGAIELSLKPDAPRLAVGTDVAYEIRPRKNLGAEGDGPLTRLTVLPEVAGPLLARRLHMRLVGVVERDAAEGLRDPGALVSQSPPLSRNAAGAALALSANLNARHRLISLTTFGREIIDDQNRSSPYADPDIRYTAPDARMVQQKAGFSSSLGWDFRATNTTALWARLGVQQTSFHDDPALCQSQPSTCDQVPGVQQAYPVASQLQNGAYRARSELDSLELATGTTLAFHSADWLTHELQIVGRARARQVTSERSVPGNAILHYDGQLPSRRQEFFANDPRVDPPRYGWRTGEASALTASVSLEDAMTLADTLTLTPGLAVLSSQAAALDNELHDTALLPQLAALWDATRDGRTLVRGGIHARADADLLPAAQHTLGAQVSRTCRWNPATQAFDDCRVSGGSPDQTLGLPCAPRGFDGKLQPCRERVGFTRAWEYSLGVDRELPFGLRFAVDGIYRRIEGLPEVGETNRVWNTSGTRSDGSFVGDSSLATDLSTPRAARRRYLGATFAIGRHFAERLGLRVAYTASSLTEEASRLEAYRSAETRSRTFELDNHRRELNALVTYRPARFLSAGLVGTYASGTPKAPQISSDVPGNFEDYRALAGRNIDPGDDRPTPRFATLHVHLQVRGRATLGPLHLEPYIDLLNVLSSASSTVMPRGTLESSWASPQSMADPTGIRVGLMGRM